MAIWHQVIKVNGSGGKKSVNLNLSFDNWLVRCSLFAIQHAYGAWIVFIVVDGDGGDDVVDDDDNFPLKMSTEHKNTQTQRCSHLSYIKDTGARKIELFARYTWGGGWGWFYPIWTCLSTFSHIPYEHWTCFQKNRSDFRMRISMWMQRLTVYWYVIKAQ